MIVYFIRIYIYIYILFLLLYFVKFIFLIMKNVFWTTIQIIYVYINIYIELIYVYINIYIKNSCIL